MIELRGLHLGNIARSPAESVRPDLWPDWAIAPELGSQGNERAEGARAGFDLAGNTSIRYVPSDPYPLATEMVPSYALTKGHGALQSNAVAINAGGGVSGRSLFGGSRAVTFYLLLNFPTISSGDFIIAEDGTAYNKNSLYVGCIGEKIQVLFRGSADYSDVNSDAGVYTAGSWASVTTRWALAATEGKAQLFVGPEAAKSTGTRILTGPLITGNTDMVFFGRPSPGGRPVSLCAPAGSAIACAYQYGSRCLTPAQILDLHADPLLPFRRRQPVYYSVPSGGGASFAASSAWRVFTAAAIDTAWAIRAALDGATSWAVITQSGAATGWRITAASDAATGWSLRTASASPSAWRILTASEADTAWSIAADLSASTAWAILTSLDAATAWAIISAGTLLANTGWAIRTDADTDTGWLLKTDTAADTAWAVRNARDAATAWDIQAALAGATAWRITTDLQADTSWTVITDMDADAAWNIMRADPTGTDWSVCTDLDTPTAWAVFSDIIPEPVRVFLAPGRQFIINAASRVLIITKPRP